MSGLITPALGVAFRGALVYASATGQTLGNGANRLVQFDAEVYDTDVIHDNVTNPTRLTVPSGVTKVRVSANLTGTTSGTARFVLSLWKNASSVSGLPRLDITSLNAGSGFLSSGVISVVAGDYFEFAIFPVSGGPWGVSQTGGTWMCMEIVE